MSRAVPEWEAAGLVAPILRNADERTLRRPVKVYDRETGEVVREATVREVVGGLAKATALGLEVVEGVKPREIMCLVCGRPAPVRAGRGRPPSMCRRCAGPASCAPRENDNMSAEPRCAGGCGAAVPVRARRRARKAGIGWSCTTCRQKRMVQRQARCAGFLLQQCAKKPPAKAFAPANHKAREGRPWRCKMHAAMDAAHRARVAKRDPSEAA